MKNQVLFLGACVTIASGTTQDVLVTMPTVEGAECVLTSSGIGEVKVTTPGTAKLARSKHDVSVICRKACYADGAAVISSNIEGMAAGNLLLGGIIGVGIDAASGASNKYTPRVDMAMVKLDKCSAN